MTTLTLASAQTCAIAGDLSGNIQRHLAFMVAAAEQGVQLLVFAELSLTGYEPALAARLAIAPGCARYGRFPGNSAQEGWQLERLAGHAVT